MDPEENRREQLEISCRILEGDATPEDSERLAELVVALDDWLSNGGFLPADWA